MVRVLEFDIDDFDAGGRLDKTLAQIQDEFSRSRIQSFIDNGDVVLNGEVFTKASWTLQEGDRIVITVPDAVSAEPEPEDIELDVIYEDADLLVINKQAGLVVHPGAGNHSGTLVNALLHYCGDDLSGIGGVMRPGIVHRLDKATTGLMVVAKHDKAHKGLSAQLEDRSLSRVYKALVLGAPMPIKGHVDMALGRDPRNRLKMAVNVKRAKTAKTFYKVEKDFDGCFSLVECRLDSGRTHQIRVHMAALKHPLIGDPLYGPQNTAVAARAKQYGLEQEQADAMVHFPRQALHAGEISFDHPVSGETMHFEKDLPDDFSKLLKIL
ncbi:MAG: RluA family pseudouridine synthase [Bdellovibrionales bacterium]